MTHCRHRTGAIALTLAIAFGSGAAGARDCSSDAPSGLNALDVDEHTALAYVPQRAIGRAAPLVVNLHPTGGKGLRTLNESRHVADEHGFVLLAPTGVIGPVFSGWTWNVPGVPAPGVDRPPGGSTRDDVEFISRAIDEAIEALCIDTRRLYAMGFSGGGRMASHLACALDHRLASIVAIGGLRFSKAADAEYGLPDPVHCSPGRALPVQAIHGRWDPVNPWFGRALGRTPFEDPANGNRPIVAETPKEGTSWSYPGELALERWVEHNGCDPLPRTTEIADGVVRHDYDGCREGAEVSLVLFEEVGHAVPGYEKPWAPGQATSPIDGYELAWELLEDDHLPE